MDREESQQARLAVQSLEDLVSTLPLISRSKTLRRSSSQLVISSSGKELVDALKSAADSTRSWNVKDIGLALHWIDIALADSDPEIAVQLMVLQAKFLGRALKTLSAGHKKPAGRSRFGRTLIFRCHKSTRAMALATRESFDMSSFCDACEPEGVYGLVAIAQLCSVYTAPLPEFSEVAKLRAAGMYTSVILQAKPQIINEVLRPFFAAGIFDSISERVITQRILDESLIPSLQKTLLRSPLFVVESIIPALMANKSLDFRNLASSVSLASSLNSQDAKLRKSTAFAFTLVLHNSSECAPKTLIEQFKKVSNSEQRELYAGILAASKPDPESTVPAALALQAGREGSESAVAALARAMVSQIRPNDATNAACLEAFRKGLKDARSQLRREWICAACSTHESRMLFQEELRLAWADARDGPLCRSLAPSAYAIISAERPSDVPPTLFSKAVMEHLAASDRDLDFLFRAATQCLDVVDAINALVFACVRGSPHSKVQRRIKLGQLFAKPEITLVELNKLTQAVEAYKCEESGRIIASIRNQHWPQVSFVLCHEQGCTPPRGWIGLCLDCNVDPNLLVQEAGEELFSAALKSKSAAALASLAFVAPEYSVQSIIGILNKELVVERMSRVDEALLDTPVGTLVDDTFSSKTSKAKARSNAKKSDEAWEEELRAEIAAKRGELTKEQREKVAAQDDRRSELIAIRSRAEFGCAILEALAVDTARGAANAPATWIPVGLQLCLKLCSENAPGRIAAQNCVTSLSSCLSDRFPGSWKTQAAELLLQGPAVDADKLRRLMYMLNPVSDKRLLDDQSMAYILPILVAFVLRTAADLASSKPSSTSGNDQHLEDLGAENTDEETTLLILTMLSNQSSVLARIPRGSLIGALHELLASFAADRSAVKDCLSRVVQQALLDDGELESLLTASVAVPQEFVQTAALEILDEEVDLPAGKFSPEIWISRFGTHHEIAQEIFEENQMVLPEHALQLLVPYFAEKYAASYAALARSYAAAAIELSAVQNALSLLCEHFKTLAPPAASGSRLPLGLAPRRVDHANERLALVGAMVELTPHLSGDSVLACADFIVAEGVLDSNSVVSAASLELGKNLIVNHGKKSADGLLPLFEDRNVVLFGFAAQYLPVNDPRLKVSIERLLKAIDESAESIDSAAAVAAASVSALSALAPLAPADLSAELLRELLKNALSPTSTRSRKGSALGFAGLSHGLGLRILGEVDVVAQISSASGDRKNAGARAGAQYLVAALAEVFRSYFEPYALELMPEILAGLGDPQAMVREPAGEAARKVMGLATSHGVSVLIPLALNQLDQTAWRSKKGAVELLGSMAYLSPRQLSASLATIVPEIVALLSDTHKEVRAAANASMRMFGDVIQNPEIQQLVPSLLRAVSNPTDHTDSALTELLKTRFVHYIDSPSLALVIFVVQRGLRDRSASTKRKACQIVGNMSILTSSEDLAPYLPAIMPDLEVAMTDPVPQTCSVACKALGVLVEKLGEHVFPDVVPNMLAKLRSAEPEAIGERWGTAQGLAEVLHGLGVRRLEKELPEIVASWQSPETHIRQGFAPLLLLLPGSFGAALTPYLGTLVPAVLNGLADSMEDIRECALKAGRRIVKGYASVAMDLLLPELEVGLWSSSWRIRLASVELVGDLLNQLLGKGGNAALADRLKSLSVAKPDDEGELASDEDGEAADTEQVLEESAPTNAEASLVGLEVLGRNRRDRVLAGLFVCRADVVGAVRQAALDVWLGLIQNTPRVVKTILPTLVEAILRHLGDEDEEIQKNAGRALAELVRRVSSTLDNVLPTFVHLLPETEYREGICHGLVELIPATPQPTLKAHESELMRIVRTCLQDSDDNVRTAATRALEQLHTILGDVAGDMLPDMVDEIVDNNDESALAAIKEMLTSAGSSSVLSATLPPLLEKIASTNEEFHALAVAELCEAAGASETRLFADEIVDTLIRADRSSILGRVLIVSCPENHLLTLAKRDDSLRAKVFAVMADYYTHASSIDMLFVNDWIVFALHGLEQKSTSVPAKDLLQAFTSSPEVSKQDLAGLSSTAYQTLSVLAESIPAFSEPPKGPAFILPIFLNGLVLGSNLQKEQSALAITEIVKRTNPVESLKPVVTQITGPLIRIVGERAPAEIKAAIIYTLNELLTVIPGFLKPFLPQLQRTFAKNLGEGSSAIVRTRSALALSTLVKHQTRIDPLAREVLAGVRAAGDDGVRAAYLSALHGIVRHAGAHLGDSERASVSELIADSTSLTGGRDDIKLLSLLSRIGADLVALTTDQASVKKLVESMIAGSELQSVLNANALFLYAPQVATGMAYELEGLLETAAASSNSSVSEFGVRGLGKLLLTIQRSENNGVYEKAISAIIGVLPKQEGRSEESRRLALVVVCTVASRNGYEELKPYWNTLVPCVFAAVRDTVIPVKIAAEYTLLAIFDFVARQDQILFDEYFAEAENELDSRQQRAMPEYVRRVAMRAAQRAVESEQSAATGAETDIAEIWAVGSE